MIKQAVALGSLLLFCTGWVFGQTARNDGTVWKGLSSYEKVLYTLGFSRGYEQGILDAGSLIAAKTMSPTPTPSPTFTPAQKKEFLEMAARANKRIVITELTYTMGQISETMTTFYGDFRNAPVCWDDALSFSAASLSGQPPTEEELSAARRADAEKGCK